MQIQCKQAVSRNWADQQERGAFQLDLVVVMCYDGQRIALQDTPEGSARTQMVFGWVLRAMQKRSMQGGINASPPVFSRVHQVSSSPMHTNSSHVALQFLSDGMTGYHNAMKVLRSLSATIECTNAAARHSVSFPLFAAHLRQSAFLQVCMSWHLMYA